MPKRKGATALRDGVPVWIDVRVAQFRGDAIFKPLGDKVFEPFGFVVNFVPRIFKEIVKEALQEPMMAKDFQSSPGSRSRQKHPMMLLVFNEGRLPRRELLEHPSHRRRPDTKMLGKRVAGHAFLLRPTQFQDGF